MPRCSATRRASRASVTEQQPWCPGLGSDASTIGSVADDDGSAGCPCRIKTPIQSCPASTSNEAVTLESTPPDMAMTMRDMKISLTKSLKGLFQ